MNWMELWQRDRPKGGKGWTEGGRSEKLYWWNGSCFSNLLPAHLFWNRLLLIQVGGGQFTYSLSTPILHVFTQFHVCEVWGSSWSFVGHASCFEFDEFDELRSFLLVLLLVFWVWLSLACMTWWSPLVRDLLEGWIKRIWRIGCASIRVMIVYPFLGGSMTSDLG